MVLIFLYNTYIHIFCYHLVLSSYHIYNPIIYHECIYALLYSYIHIYSFLYSYLFISFIHHILYAFLSGFSYSRTFYISIMYAFTYSYIHIIYTYIHILSYTCFYCQMLLYCISYTVPYYLLCHPFTMPIIRVHALIPVLCHLLLIFIVLIIYAFLSCVPSMFHHIHFGMSIIYSYHIRCIYISFFIYFSFTFMFMFMFRFIFQFVFMFHIIFIFSCSSMNLLYLKIGIIPIDSSKFKLWHFHAN